MTPTCPFCGETMSDPIRFCTACGRSVSKEDMARVGIKIGKGGSQADGKTFTLARREYSMHRQVRTTFYTLSAVLAILIGYYCTFKYVLKQHLPYNLDVMVGAPIQAEEAPAIPAPKDPQSHSQGSD